VRRRDGATSAGRIRGSDPLEPSKAVGLGRRNDDQSRSDDALDPLRGLANFRLLMMDLASPAEAFARGE
jgi:hypothetical protein